jgi:hypothetical protein
MASNQLRLWLSTFAYLLLERLRTLALPNTVLERAELGILANMSMMQLQGTAFSCTGEAVLAGGGLAGRNVCSKTHSPMRSPWV